MPEQFIVFPDSVVFRSGDYYRKHDYELHNIETIWIIDGNESLMIDELDNNRFMIEFINDCEWKYNSFIYI